MTAIFILLSYFHLFSRFIHICSCYYYYCTTQQKRKEIIIMKEMLLGLYRKHQLTSLLGSIVHSFRSFWVFPAPPNHTTVRNVYLLNLNVFLFILIFITNKIMYENNGGRMKPHVPTYISYR